MKKFCWLFAVGIFWMSGAASAYSDGTLLKEKNGTRVYKINNGFKILVDASEIGGRKPIEVSPAELSQIKDVSIGQSYGSMSAQSYGAAQNGQAVKNYAIPGNASIGTIPMPKMAIGGVTTPATLYSATPTLHTQANNKASSALGAGKELDLIKGTVENGGLIFDVVSGLQALDGSTRIRANVFNKGEADAVIEIRDSNGTLVGLPKLIPGNKRYGSTLDILSTPIEVGKSIFDGYSLMNDRNGLQSRSAKVDISVPLGGSFKLTKNSEWALKYNLLTITLDWVGEVWGAGGKNISENVITSYLKEIPQAEFDLLRKKYLDQNLEAKDMVAFSLKMVKPLLKSENIDGRTKLGKLVAKWLGEPTVEGATIALDLIAKEAKAFNTVNTVIDLMSARKFDTTISFVDRTPQNQVKANVGTAKPIQEIRSNSPLATSIQGNQQSQGFDPARAGQLLKRGASALFEQAKSHHESEYQKIASALLKDQHLEKIQYLYNVWLQPFCTLDNNDDALSNSARWNCKPLPGDPYHGFGHTGIDIYDVQLTHPFYAISRGTVIEAGDKNLEMNTIAIYDKEHDWTTLYLHASTIDVKKNDQVEVGQQLGTQGNRGEGTCYKKTVAVCERNPGKSGFHVHFGVRPGQRIDDLNGTSGNNSLDPIAVAMMYLGTSPQQVVSTNIQKIQAPQANAAQINNASVQTPMQPALQPVMQAVNSIQRVVVAPVVATAPSQPPVYTTPTQKTPMNGGATANMMAANAAQYDLANCLGPELKRKISMPVSSRDEFLQLEKEVMAEAKRICGNGTQQQNVTSVQNHVQPAQQSVTPAQANNQAVIGNDISALAARNDCVKRLLPGAEQKLKAISTNINPTDYMSRQHAILAELYRNCGLPQGYTVPPQNPVTATQYPATVAAVPTSNMPTHVQPKMQSALQPVMQAVNPSQRVVAPVQPLTQAAVQPPPANIRPNAPLPVVAAQAQQIASQPPPQIQAVNPSQRVVVPVVVMASAQPPAQAAVQHNTFQSPPANMRPNVLLPIAAAQAQPIVPQPQPQIQAVKPTQAVASNPQASASTLALQFNGFSSNYSTASTPYQPTIALSGSGFNSVTQIKWTCAMPNGVSCGTLTPWASANWNGKFIRYSDTSAVVAPMLLVATDPKGTYHWTATFYGAGQPVVRSFAVTKN